MEKKNQQLYNDVTYNPYVIFFAIFLLKSSMSTHAVIQTSTIIL